MLPHSNTGVGVFTCVSCEIRFPSADLQRMHMKTEWHRYNLKRRVAQLPAVPADVFQLKVQQQRSSEKYDEFGFKLDNRKTRTPRWSRQKPQTTIRSMSPVSVTSTFTLGSELSDRSRSPSVVSPTRSGNTTDIDEFFSSDDEVTGSDGSLKTYEPEHPAETQPLPVTTCYLCGENHGSLEDNVTHMYSHGLYIPEQSSLVDLAGLIRFLSDVVVIDNECLKCGFVGKNLEGIRQHMMEKGHCVVPYETEDDQLLLSTFYSPPQIKLVRVEDECVVDSSGVELQLANGARLGNRQYMRYFRQNLYERPVSDGDKTVSCVYEESDYLNRRLKRSIKVDHVAQRRADQKFLVSRMKKQNKIRYFRDEII